VGPGALDHAIQHAEIELAFLGLDLVPGNACQDGVDFGLNQPGHAISCSRGWWRCCWPVLRIKPEWFAIDDQLGGRPLLRK